MVIYKDKFSPQRIRIIRESLGLSQVKAEELFNCAPRAFEEYESGVTKPDSALKRRLMILETALRH